MRSDVCTWPWPWLSRPKSNLLALVLIPQVLGLDSLKLLNACVLAVPCQLFCCRASIFKERVDSPPTLCENIRQTFVVVGNCQVFTVHINFVIIVSSDFLPLTLTSRFHALALGGPNSLALILEGLCLGSQSLLTSLYRRTGICIGPTVRKRQNLVKRLIASYADKKTGINSEIHTKRPQLQT